MVVEKLPMFCFCAAWISVSGLELPLAHPTRTRATEAAKRMGARRVDERVFIFMAADCPLLNVAIRGGSAAAMLSFDVVLYHTEGMVGNRGAWLAIGVALPGR